MEFLYFLEDIRFPGLNELMLGVTYFGDEIAFLVIALVLFWCVDKRMGYYVMSVGFFGTLANQFLKITCRIPRPWVLDENFTILEQAREAATGYSFPSGHTQNSVGTFGSIALTVKDKWIRGLCIALTVLVPLSRMYIGVHTPADVLVAAAMAVVLMLVMKPVIYGNQGKYIPVMLWVGLGLAMAYLCYVELFPFPADVDEANLHSAVKNAYTLLGALSGMLVVHHVDEKWLHFPTNAIWWAQILKLAGGLALVLAVKEGTKVPLELIFSGHLAARGVRYFLVVAVAGLVWPLTFRWFEKLGKKEETV
jgi:membrane-associated phospholipid phosphatase